MNPVLWIDFADSSTVTTVSGNISQVNDKSTSGYDFTQSTPGSRPAYVAGLNGRNVARFDGTDDLLTLGSSDLARNVTGATVYVVRKVDTINGTAQSMFSVSTPNSTLNRLYLAVAATTGNITAGGRTLDADSFNGAGVGIPTSILNTQIQTTVYDYTNTDAFQYLNKNSISSNTSYQSATTTSNTASANSQIGSTGSGVSQYFDGDIGEVLVFHSAHTAAERDFIWSYLGAKWDITAFNPTNEDLIRELSPAMWLDASDTSTLFNATSGGSLPSVGAGVARIEDKSANGFDLTQATSGKRPLRQEINGMSMLRFDGTDDIMTMGSSTLLRNKPGFTMFMVNNKLDDTGADRFFHILNNTTGFRLIFNITVATNSLAIQSVRLDSGAGGFPSGVTGGAPTLNEWVVNSGMVDFANTYADIKRNKEILNSRTDMQSSGNFSDTNSAGAALGGNIAEANYANFEMGEFILFDYILTDEQIDIVNNYLGFKWASIFTLDII